MGHGARYPVRMNPDNSMRNIIIGILAIVVVLAAGVLIFKKKSAAPAPAGAASTTAASTTAPSKLNTSLDLSSLTGTSGTTTPAYTIKMLPNAPEHPQIDRPLAFSGGVSADQKLALQQAADKLQAELKKDPTNLRYWLNLGTVRLMAGDLEGAKQAWVFVSLAAPSDVTANFNLGNLFAAHYKDYPKAETYYLKAISLNKTDTNGYRALFEIYSSVYKTDTNAAEDILKQGIAAAPKAVDLQVMLARYWREKGLASQAKTEYDAAIANAKSQNLTQLAADIQAERDAL